MAKVQRVLFSTNYYELGEVKFAKGLHYPITAETQTRVKAGDAEFADFDMPKADAAAEDAEARIALERERQASLEAEREAAEREAQAKK